MSTKSLGGYNSLNLNSYSSSLTDHEYSFQSARASLYFFCKYSDVKVLYLPEYICESLSSALKSLHISIVVYELNSDLTIKNLPNLLNKEFILIVNYFGLLDEYINELSKSENSERFIIDCSQALFFEPKSNITSIYSPRKFLPVPDGGFLKSQIVATQPTLKWDSSKHLSHLLLRSLGFTEEGYRYFLEAESALEDFEPKQMSIVTKELIKRSDLDIIKEMRRKNFAFLNESLKEFNKFKWELGNCIPLCYPLMLDIDVGVIHKELCDKRIYLPRYWPIYEKNKLSEVMYNNTLFIPIDERIALKDYNVIVNKITTKDIRC
ncbi:hypothetical protein [Vibrio fluvialis]|uniref:hypothetical protein n=1 Tax=Vibrio fluvialis TaxID=676 RepID=UPI0025743DEF|nr:hypothetical protein [Vibrio fluvialis]BEI22390.1 hypothetical protein KKIDH5335_07220 [Vibrio fluvialis]